MLREQERVFNTPVQFFVGKCVYLNIIDAEIMRFRELVQRLFKVFPDFRRRECLFGYGIS